MEATHPTALRACGVANLRHRVKKTSWFEH
jgi:hypothetical protein